MTAPDILKAAAAHMAARAATYDKPKGERSMARTVTVFNAFHNRHLTEAQGWHFMQILKDVRLFQNPEKYHADSAEDGVAYAALKGEALGLAEAQKKLLGNIAGLNQDLKKKACSIPTAAPDQDLSFTTRTDHSYDPACTCNNCGYQRHLLSGAGSPITQDPSLETGESDADHYTHFR